MSHSTSELISFSQNGKFIQEVFEEQAKKVPHQIAVTFNDENISFEVLNNRCNKLAAFVRDKGIKPNEVVAVIMDRSIELIITLLGIVKAGAAYLPIDPRFPQERIDFLVKDSQARLIISEKQHASPSDNAEVLNIRDLSFDDGEFPNLPLINKLTDLMYIIYTSGSTGNPKGVMIEHRSIINRVFWAQKKYPMTAHDTYLFKTPYTFDVSLPEIFWPGLAGSSMCILPSGEEGNPKLIIDLIAKCKVTRVHFVPSMLNAFLEYLVTTDVALVKSLKYVFASGEALPATTVVKFNDLLFNSNGTQLVNLYGPTEAAVDVSYFECSPFNGSIIPIGKPIDNIRLYILDQFKQRQSQGMQGELYISGIGVARGYLNNELLTNEFFEKDPFSPNQIMYRTGDRARLNNQGDIEFLGRIDNQVKVNGYRIEPGEVEEALREHGAIKDCVVIMKIVNDQKKLIAYFTANNTISAFELKKALNKKLPAYCVPSVFTLISEIPLTSSGKANRRYLESLPVDGLSHHAFVEPLTHLEKQIATIWREVLSIDKVGANEDFFSLGGSSILAIKVILAIKSSVGVELTINDLISNDLRRIAEKCEQELLSA